MNRSGIRNRLRSLLPLLVLMMTGAAGADSKPLWDEWYTMTVGGKIHYGYYNEKVEPRKDHRIFYKSEVWKREEGYQNREATGELAEDDESLTPLFFNFHANYRTTETNIDGNFTGNRLLTVKIRQGDRELPVIKKNVPSSAFLATCFPLWLGRHLESMKTSVTKSFHTIAEDSYEQGYELQSGTARIEKPDARADRLHAKKLSVSYRGLQSTWWIDPRGAAYRIEMPSQKVVVERATKNEALHFLDGK